MVPVRHDPARRVALYHDCHDDTFVQDAQLKKKSPGRLPGLIYLSHLLESSGVMAGCFNVQPFH